MAKFEECLLRIGPPKLDETYDSWSDVLAYSEDQERDDHGRFGSGSEGTKVTEREREALIHDDSDKLTDAESGAMHFYTFGGGYEEVNGALRDGDTHPTVKAMDSAFEKSAGLPHDSVLYRGAGNVFDSVKPGDVIEDKAYLSTSNEWAVASMFSTSYDEQGYEIPGGTIAEMHVPAGTKALGGERGEHEIILPRGTSWKVTGARTDENGLNHVIMHLQQ